jgi:Secretion system C-terminal sorting domain
VGAGSTTITASQAASTNYSAATSVDQSITVLAGSVTVSADANLSSYTTTSATDVTVTAGVLTVDANASVKTMTVAPGAKLTLASGKTLTVAGALTLQSDATGTATFVDNGGTITAASKNVEQYLTSGRNWYVSSPVLGSKSDVLSASVTHPVYLYDEVHGTSAPWPTITNTTTDLNVMQGYVTNPATTGVITFSGTLNTGAKSIDVTRTAGQIKEGFNLVGNPYPSYLNWDNATKTDLLTSIWYRTKTSGDVYTFDTYNSTGGVSTSNGVKAITNLIPPMQAFWVRVAQGQTSGTFSVTNSQRAHADTGSNGFKSKSSTTSTQPVVCLEVSNGTTSDQALVYFNAGATNSFDSYDSPKMSNETASIPEIYTLAGSEQVVINGVNDMTQMTLGFTTGEANNFTIKAAQFANFANGTQIVLRDNMLNVEQDLTVGDYNFYSDVTTNNETRFTLTFKAPSVATGMNQNASNNVWISLNANNQIVVNGATGETTVAVYNAVGQKLSSKTLKSTSSVLNHPLTSGVYFVTVTNSGKTITQKVIVD